MSDQERLGPPVIEPLSDVSWARVERNLWSGMDSARGADVRPTAPRRWLWLAAPVLAAAGIAIVLGMRGSNPVPVPVSSVDEHPMRLVSSAAPSFVTVGDAHVTLDAETAVVMNRDRDTQTALLERGAAWFSIAPRVGRPPFVVLAGDTVVRVVGTRFRVARSEERATVEVEHGIVEVQYRGSSAQLAAGQRWSSEQPTVVTTMQALPEAPTAAAAAPPAPAPQPDVRIVDSRSPDTRPARDPVPSKRDPKVTETQAETRALAATSADADRAQFDRMQALEVRDPAAAITGYLELTRSTRWAEVALFAAGRLAADRRDPRATKLLSDYVRRFPAGANVADARELLVHLKGEH